MNEFTATDRVLDPIDSDLVAGGRALLRELLQRKAVLLGMAGLTLLLFCALFAPWIALHDPLEQNLSISLAPPFWMEDSLPAYPLGTDVLGRDLLSRLIYGARYSLLISVSAALLGSLLGLLVGLIAGFYGRWADTVLMRLGDVQLAFPFVLLAIIFLGTASERGPLHLILVLGIPSWIIYGRVVRSRVLAERQKEYVLTARAAGASSRRILQRYILPNVWQVVPVITMLDIGYLVIIESMLSFLGFGLTPPTPSWGAILATGKQYMIVTPWMPILPGLAIMVTVLSINLVADGLGDLLDPQLARGSFRRTLLKPVVLGSARASNGHDANDPEGAPLLRVQDLVVDFPAKDRTVRAVRGISFDMDRGQALGIVGESGSGKSVTALAIIQLLEAPGRVTAGQIHFDGYDLTRIPDRTMETLRGKRISMIFQNPTASLNPVLTVRAQMTETLRSHRGLSRNDALAEARSDLLAVGIGNPDQVLGSYPFQLSGGMNQRVMIAIALGTQPDLLIADEPTTALDVTTQAQILEDLKDVQRQLHTSLILITHDVALLSGFADLLLVLYAGQVCELGPADSVLQDPQHPYTQALINAVPRAEHPAGVPLETIPGDPPDPTEIVSGCPFAERCPAVMDVCHTTLPAHHTVGTAHTSACHLHVTAHKQMDVA